MHAHTYMDAYKQVVAVLILSAPFSLCTTLAYLLFTTDLFKKKYDFEHQVKVLNTTADGVRVETHVVAPQDGALRGVFKSTVPVRTFGIANGEFESEFH